MIFQITLKIETGNTIIKFNICNIFSVFQAFAWNIDKFVASAGKQKDIMAESF